MLSNSNKIKIKSVCQKLSIFIIGLILYTAPLLKADKLSQTEKHFQYLKKIILAPHDFYKLQRSFQIITLSFLSEGLKNYFYHKPDLKVEISKLFEQIIYMGLKSPIAPVKQVSIHNIKNYSGYGLYISHLNIILINYYLAINNKKYFVLNEKLNFLLLQEIARNKSMHIRAYPHYNSRFPADQAAVCYSLWLYDQTYKTSYSSEVVKKWTTLIQTKYLNKRYLLPVSEINYRFWYSPYPRGCATPYLIYFLNFFAPKQAKNYWQKFKIYFKGKYGSLTLFKEWLIDKKNSHYTGQLALWKKWHGLRGDPDTGPIINGYGAAATGISLLAARAVKDNAVYQELSYSINDGFFMLQFLNNKFYNQLKNPLAIAIIFASETM